MSSKDYPIILNLFTFSRSSHRQCVVWSYRTEEVAIWCVEWWCYNSQYYGANWSTWVQFGFGLHQEVLMYIDVFQPCSYHRSNSLQTKQWISCWTLFVWARPNLPYCILWGNKPHSHLFNLLFLFQDHQDLKLPDEKTFQSLDSIKTVISHVDDSEQPLNTQDITLKVEDLTNSNNYLSTDLELENNHLDQRKHSAAVLSVNSDQDIGMETRKNSNTSIRTVQSMPKYTECLAADKPFANISNKRMIDNITRAVS